jgi:DNA modification methylase
MSFGPETIIQGDCIEAMKALPDEVRRHDLRGSAL